jgi:hypothetical protein
LSNHVASGYGHLMPTPNPAIPRHKTAIRRVDLSRPIKSALDSGMIDPTTSVFDYGCGHGQDIALLAANGIPGSGWDSLFCHSRPPSSLCGLYRRISLWYVSSPRF